MANKENLVKPHQFLLLFLFVGLILALGNTNLFVHIIRPAKYSLRLHRQAKCYCFFHVTVGSKSVLVDKYVD